MKRHRTLKRQVELRYVSTGFLRASRIPYLGPRRKRRGKWAPEWRTRLTFCRSAHLRCDVYRCAVQLHSAACYGYFGFGQRTPSIFLEGFARERIKGQKLTRSNEPNPNDMLQWVPCSSYLVTMFVTTYTSIRAMRVGRNNFHNTREKNGSSVLGKGPILMEPSSKLDEQTPDSPLQ